MVKRHLRRFPALVLYALFRHDAMLALLGFLNRRFRFIETVFVAYPASREYAEAFVYSWQLERMKWRPIPVGCFLQNGRMGMVFGVSATDEDFYQAHRADDTAPLRHLVDHTERIRCLVAAPRASFAGILPGILTARELFDASDALGVTVDAVIQAEAAVRAAVGYADDVPLILLGGRGFVGRRLSVRLAGRNLIVVDVVDERTTWPNYLHGQPAILVNLTKKAALRDYLPLWWRELVLLNEVYPEPSADEIAALTEIGAPAFHLAGIKAQAVPAFPKGYRGGVPCCAAWPDSNLEVVIRRLGDRSLREVNAKAPSAR